MMMLASMIAAVVESLPVTHTGREMHVIHFFDGVTLALAMIAALLFVRYWRRTHDRLFLFFAAAFFIYGLNRLFFQFRMSRGDFANMWLYAVRLVAFAIVIAGIMDKNLRSRHAKAP